MEARVLYLKQGRGQGGEQREVQYQSNNRIKERIFNGNTIRRNCIFAVEPKFYNNQVPVSTLGVLATIYILAGGGSAHPL